MKINKQRLSKLYFRQILLYFRFINLGEVINYIVRFLNKFYLNLRKIKILFFRLCPTLLIILFSLI